MSHIRWGLLSTANINRRLIPAFRKSARGDLLAVASRSRDRAQAYADRWEIPQAFASYEALLASGAVDAVYIGLPNHLHAEWAVKALDAGVHVLCEKPFALTLAEVDAMIAARDRSGRVLAEAFMYRHHPQTRQIGEMVRKGMLGDISVVRGMFNFAMRDPDSNIRMKPELGGGCLWDVGIYPLSFAQFIMGGPPEYVHGAQWIGSSGVDETFAGQMVYTGNRLAQIAGAFRTPLYTNMEVIGTAGRLYLEQPFVNMRGGGVYFTPKDGDSEPVAVPDADLYLGEVEDMHAAILDGAPNYLDLSETRNHVRTVLALYQSARTQQTVYLKDVT